MVLGVQLEDLHKFDRSFNMISFKKILDINREKCCNLSDLALNNSNI